MTTFHPFPRLPLELREQIWKDTVEPRTVDVRRFHRWGLIGVRTWGQTLTLSSTPVPAILQSCREARNLGLYKRIFLPTDETGDVPRDTEQRYVWLDFDIDMVDIGTSDFRWYKSIALAIKRLKFERENGNEAFYNSESSELDMFVNVEEIHIVCADGFWMWGGALYDHCWPCAEEKLLFIDPSDGRVARGLELETIYEQMLKAARLAANGEEFSTDDEFSS